jgi:hypothetical protein
MVGNEGMIEYKFNETFDQHLRCAFIIRSLNHSGFIFTLEENGLVDDPTIQGGAISIFSFSAEGLMDISNLYLDNHATTPPFIHPIILLKMHS